MGMDIETMLILSFINIAFVACYNVTMTIKEDE